MKRIFIIFGALFFAANAAYAQPARDLVARINEGAALFCANPGGFDTIFSPDFLNQVPASQLTAISTGFFDKYGGVVRWSYLDSSKIWSAKVRLVLSKGFSVDMSIVASESGNHLITGLLLGAPTPQLNTLDDLVTKISKLRGTTGFLAAQLTANGIEPIAQWNPDTALALGSAFKLYVLATLLKEINSGHRHWSDVIYLDSASRAFPSGEMHAWPIGTPVTLATAATLMISISDNTAADLLAHTLGRMNIEAMLQETGNTHANRDIPFLTTLEMFKLKSHDAQIGKQYVELPAKKRNAYLNHDVATFPRDSVSFGVGPEMIDNIEWFASPRDMANLLKYIHDHSATGEGSHLRDILAVNPGLSIDKSKWKYVGYKGGSEPGVLNLSFLLQSKSTGNWYVITGTWNDTNAALEESDFEGYIQRATELTP
jgi:Beta-lactamase enzyme family